MLKTNVKIFYISIGILIISGILGVMCEYCPMMDIKLEVEYILKGHRDFLILFIFQFYSCFVVIADINN